MMSASAFDFETKRCATVTLEAIPALRARGQFCWLRVSGDSFDHIADVLATFDVDLLTIERIQANECAGHFHVGSRCIDLSVMDVRFVGEDFQLSALHLVMGENFLITVNKDESPTVVGMLSTFEADFHTSAQSAGFLLFELGDHLIDSYRKTLGVLARRVEDIQSILMGNADDTILTQVSALTRSLLDFRRAVVASREIIHELATRRSPFVQPSTQPFLEKQTLPLERLASDAATERTVLSESLSLYMGIVSHRTNRVLNRLTIVSMIFLPLSFLAALYGMNFEHMPELKWQYGYMAFWAACTVLVLALLGFMRRKRWI